MRMVRKEEEEGRYEEGFYTTAVSWHRVLFLLEDQRCVAIHMVSRGRQEI